MRLLASSCFLICGLAGNLFGQERQFKNENIAITPPAGWQQLANDPALPSVFATFSDANKTRRILLMIVDGRALPPVIDGKYTMGYDSAIIKAGDIQILGLHGYERFGSYTTKGKTISALSEAVIAKEKHYQIMAVCDDGDADKDPEIQKCLASFRFLSPPPSPNPAADDEAAADKLGQTIGRWLVYGTMLVGGLVAVVIIICDRIRRRQLPPPPSR